MGNKTLKEILDFSLIDLGDKFTLTVMDVIELALVILITLVVLYLIKKAIYKSKRLELGKKYSLNNLIRYIFYILSLSIILNIFGFSIKYVMAGSAALLVGIGLGLQNLFSDFVSGIVILIDSSIKVGDVLDVDGLVCQVEEINLRTTLVLTRDDKYILLPNTLLTRNKIVNWTHTNTASRFEVSVGVDYSSDVNLVMRLIKEVCMAQEDVLKQPEPFVRFNDFGNSSLDFTVYFWATNVFRVENIKSEIRVGIFKAFSENNITIPFPQRVLHFENKEDISQKSVNG
ncbi:Potassium efflux system KefA protein [uncultured Paludibacter sp.]|nr:Potassium efflux system KefA protein [uncultured Paludibacter sp.]